MQLIKDYVTNKNYLAIYLNRFGDSFAKALVEIFTGAHFYALGMPLHFILLFFGLEFGFRGFFSPLGTMLTSRIGIAKTLLTAYFFEAIFFIGIALSHHSLYIGFFAFIFHSIARGIFDPCENILHAVYIKNKNRGRELTAEGVIDAVSMILAVALGGLLLTYYSYFPIAVLAIIILLLSTLPFFLLLEKIHTKTKITFTDPYKFMVSKKFRENILTFTGYSFTVIASVIVAPIFIFVLFPDFTILSAIIILAIFIELITVLCYGWFVDKQRKKSVKFAGLFQVFGYVGYAFLMKTPLAAYTIHTYNKIARNILRGSYGAEVDQKVKNSEHMLLFCSARQMVLCFAEVIILPLYALLAFFTGTYVFPIIFISSILGVYFTVAFLKE